MKLGGVNMYNTFHNKNLFEKKSSSDLILQFQLQLLNENRYWCIIAVPSFWRDFDISILLVRKTYLKSFDKSSEEICEKLRKYYYLHIKQKQKKKN